MFHDDSKRIESYKQHGGMDVICSLKREEQVENQASRDCTIHRK
jgi:hypothetical protein